MEQNKEQKSQYNQCPTFVKRDNQQPGTRTSMVELTITPE
jgi:hypothetical protein